MSTYGNPNLIPVFHSQYIDFGAVSEQSAAIPAEVDAVSLYASQDCWVAVGENPTAEKPGAEKTRVKSFPLRSGVVMDIPVTRGKAIKVAVIQDSVGGVLDVVERR